MYVDVQDMACSPIAIPPNSHQDRNTYKSSVSDHIKAIQSTTSDVSTCSDEQLADTVPILCYNTVDLQAQSDDQLNGYCSN